MQHSKREVEEAGRRGDVGDVGDPEAIRPDRGEVAADQIRRGRCAGIPTRRTVRLPSADALHAGDAHQAAYALAADVHAVRGQLGVHAGNSVGPARAGMNGLNLGPQGDVGSGPRGQRPLPPRIVAAGRDSQDAAQRGDAMGGPVRRHELEPLDGIEPVSLANQAWA